MKILTKVLFLFAVVLLAGCSHQNPLVGSWTGSQTTPQGAVITTTWNFTNDGKNITTMTAAGGPYSGRTITGNGTYTVNGSTLEQTIGDWSEPGNRKITPNPPTETYQYTINGNTLTVRGGGLPMALVFTRQSS